MMKVLASHKYAQCHVVYFDNGIIQLVSYNTPVVEIHNNGYVYALEYFDCSATTRKHVGWFLKEYTAFDYKYFKKAVIDGYAVHKFNSDIVPV